ncbi:MAG: MOSC domain-containing protein [Frankiales bacterium]|nr:MOSC domain-containing protein [Frankiales bacterium]
MDLTARVVALQRFPVKSMLGLAVDTVVLTERGIDGDRLWSVRTSDGKIGSGKNTRRFAAVPRLLELRGEVRSGDVVVGFPDGSRWPVDSPETAQRVSAFVGQPVTLARETEISHFDDGPVSLLGSASVAAVSADRGVDVDPRRFRANVLLETTAAFVEESWVRRELRLGSATLAIEMPSPRCVMVDMETAELPEQHGNLLAIGRINEARLGVIARVVTPGAISIGDEARLA